MGEHAQCRGTPTWELRLGSRSAPPTPQSLGVKSKKKGHHRKMSLYVILTHPGHTPLVLRNTVDVYKAYAKWILLHTRTVVTPWEVFKNCSDRSMKEA